MSAHVLLNLLNKLRKREKMQGLLRILSLNRNEFNKLKKNKSTNARFYFNSNQPTTRVGCCYD